MDFMAGQVVHVRRCWKFSHQDHQWSSVIGKNIYGTFSWTVSTAFFGPNLTDRCGIRPQLVTKVSAEVMARRARVVHCSRVWFDRVRAILIVAGNGLTESRIWFCWQRAVQQALRVDSWWSSKIVMITFINAGEPLAPFVTSTFLRIHFFQLSRRPVISEGFLGNGSPRCHVCAR